jgi:hypothetical protein
MLYKGLGCTAIRADAWKRQNDEIKASWSNTLCGDFRRKNPFSGGIFPLCAV